MPGLRGMLTLDQLDSMVEDGTIDTVVTAFPDHYGRMEASGWMWNTSSPKSTSRAPTPAITC